MTPTHFTPTQDEFDALKITLAARDAEIKQLKEALQRVQQSVKAFDTARDKIYQHYVDSSKLNTEAIKTLDSEREANAILTAELETKNAEIERLRKGLQEVYLGIAHPKDHARKVLTAKGTNQ